MTWTYRNDGTANTGRPEVLSRALSRPRAHASAKPIEATQRSTQAPSTNRRQRSVTTDQSKLYVTRKITATASGGGRGANRPPVQLGLSDLNFYRLGARAD